jgi:hypothetical protein
VGSLEFARSARAERAKVSRVGDHKPLGPTVVAVLAVLVTGAVGYAGVVSTREAASSSERSAEAIEIRATRSAREQADVTELRTVLDKALLDLQRLGEAVQAEQITWNNHLLAVHLYHQANTARRTERAYRPQHSRSTAAVESSDYDLSRLDVRLGSRHPLTELYSAALNALSGDSREMAICLHGGCGVELETERQSEKELRNGLHDEGLFIEAAVKFVNSQT